jgi:hypothetical protein
MNNNSEMIKEVRELVQQVYYQLDGSQVIFTDKQILIKLELVMRILLKLFIALDKK